MPNVDMIQRVGGRRGGALRQAAEHTCDIHPHRLASVQAVHSLNFSEGNEVARLQPMPDFVQGCDHPRIVLHKGTTAFNRSGGENQTNKRNGAETCEIAEIMAEAGFSPFVS